jgi:hypothetical protein
MSVPSLKSNGGHYRLTWLDEGLLAEVDRIREDSHFNVTAEVCIRSTAPGTPNHLHQARLNLTSTSARRTLANHLGERLNHLDWNAVVEQLSVKVLEAHRQGEPVIELAGHATSERVGYRLMPLLQERQASLAFGHGDSGKSWLGVLAGVLVASGIPHVGFAPEPGNVLYLDYETDSDTIFERAAMVAEGLNMAVPAGFFYRYMSQLLATDVEALQKHVLERDISLVIVDSAAPAVGEPESAQMTADYFRALRSLKVTSLTIAHVAKTGKETEPFGSIFWRNLPRSNFRVNGVHEPGASSFIVGLKHTKSNNGQRLKDIGLEISFTGDAVHFERADLADIPDLARGLSTRERLVHALGREPKAIKFLAEELDLPESNIRTTLNRGKGTTFIQLDEGMKEPRWGVLADPESL